MFSRFRVQIASAASSLLTLLAIGTVIFKFLEDWSWMESFYFSIVTLSTVGYGDLHPTSDLSRLFAGLYILVGVTLALSSFAIIGMRYLELREDNILSKREKDNLS